MFKKIITDINSQVFQEINKNQLIPQAVKLEFAGQGDFQTQFHLYQYKKHPESDSEWILYVSLSYHEAMYVFSYTGKQIPTFLITEVFNTIDQHSSQHQGNKLLINQILNQNGYKNYEQIIKDIFLQEMQNKLDEDYFIDSANQYKDYRYLFQTTLNRVKKILNSISLLEPENRELFYDLLSVEKSLTDLNTDFLLLYFFKLKEQQIARDSESWLGLSFFIPYFSDKVVYHLKLLATYLNNYTSEKGTAALSLRTRLSEEFQDLLIHLNNLKEGFKEINALKTIVNEDTELKNL